MDFSASKTSGQLGLKLLGSLALVLGILGTCISLAGLTGVWILASDIREPVTRLFSGVTDLGGRLEQHALEATQKIENSRTSVRELDTELDRKIKQWLQGLDVDPQWIGMLRQRLQHLAERVEDWRAVADLAEQFIAQALGLIEGAATWLKADLESVEQLRTAVNQGQQEVNNLLDLFENLEQEVTTLLANDQPPAAETNRSDTLFLRIDQTLGLLMTHCTSFAESVNAVEKTAAALQYKIIRLTNRIAWILSGLLCWQAAAQGCLGFCGWKLLYFTRTNQCTENDKS